MKKLLAFLLVLVMILSISLAACANKPVESEDDDDDGWGNGGDVSSSTADTKDDNNNNDNNSNVPSNVWTEKNDKVYAGMSGVRLRTAPSTDASSQVVTTVAMGTALDRIGTNGLWDKLTYNEQEVYVASALVTTVGTNFTFNTLSEENYVTLTMVDDYKINLRSSPFLPGGDYAFQNIVIENFSAANGTLTKVGVSTSGNWYKVKYVGKIGDKTFDGTEDLYFAASSVSAGYVKDPSVSGSGSVGGIG